MAKGGLAGSYVATVAGPSGDATGAADLAMINAAIAAANTTGGGKLTLRAGSYMINASIMLKDKVLLEIPAGTILQWVGALGGTIFTNDAAGGPLQLAGVVGGGEIDPQTSCDFIFDLHSPQFCQFGRGLRVSSARTGSVGVRIRCDVASTSAWEANKNAMFNTFDHLAFDQIGTIIDLIGTGTGALITLNTFRDIEARSVQAFGVRCRAWCDNNKFDGYHRYSMTANNGVGVQMNTSASDGHVYANHWAFLAVDTFAGAFSGRIGVELYKSKDTVIDCFHQNPLAEGGAVVDHNSDSHLIRCVTGGTTSDAILEYRKGMMKNGTPPRSVDPVLCQLTPTIGVANRGLWYKAEGSGTISKIAVEIGVSSGNLCVAVYRDNGLVGVASAPTGNPVATSGSVASPGTGYREISLGATIDVHEGDWLFLSADNTTVTFLAMSGGASGSSIGAGRQYFAATSHPAPSPAPALTAGRLYGHCLIGIA